MQKAFEILKMRTQIQRKAEECRKKLIAQKMIRVVESLAQFKSNKNSRAVS